MKLGQAANYFNRTAFDGWTGSAWVSNVITGALHGYDRTPGSDQFEAKRRVLLADPSLPLSATYSVLRVHNETDMLYMVGTPAKDVESDVYSLIYPLHLATLSADLMENVLTTRASGVPAVNTSTKRATVYGDMERMQVGDTKVLHDIGHTVYAVVLPVGTTVNRNYDLVISSKTYKVQECYPFLGFVRCQVVEKDV